MNRVKKLLFASGTAAMLMAGISLVSAPQAEAASRQIIDDCTFCGTRTESCRAGGRTGTRTCYYVMGGSGSCPPCTPCETSGLIDPWE